MDELLIRIKSRAKGIKHNHVRLPNGYLLHTDSHKISFNSQETLLQKREFEILYYFITHPNRVIGKEEIINELYEENPISDATFRVYIKNIKHAFNGESLLRNVRGVGYIFETV
jgi:two-component system phosphate regulon response regulator PhoB